jgi:phosphatidylglycerophosphate synthase
MFTGTLVTRMPASFIKIAPNVLSSARLALAFVFPIIPEGWRLPTMIAGGLSDWIDGLIARRYQATSAPGALLDAIADKLFTVSVLLTVFISGEAEWWQAAAVLSRDSVVALIACYALLIGRPDAFRHMRPRLPGKLATTAVFVWLLALLAHMPAGVGWWVFIVATCASALAGVDYFLQFVRRYDEVREAAPFQQPGH